MVVVNVETGPPLRVAIPDDPARQPCYVTCLLGELSSELFLAPAVPYVE